MSASAFARTMGEGVSRVPITVVLAHVGTSARDFPREKPPANLEPAASRVQVRAFARTTEEAEAMSASAFARTMGEGVSRVPITVVLAHVGTSAQNFPREKPSANLEPAASRVQVPAFARTTEEAEAMSAATFARATGSWVDYRLREDGG